MSTTNYTLLIRTMIAALLLACLTAPASSGGRTSLAHLHAERSTTPPIGWVQFCRDAPSECVPGTAGPATVPLTPSRWRELVEVNLRLNAAIEPVSDEEQYGEAERWTFATSGKGDCEDYVLEKRRELARRGWPLSTLLINVVFDQNGGGHAVLSVMTDRGEFILDNQTNEILPWSRSKLVFVKRQSAEDPNLWVDLGRTPGRPDVATASRR
jgi:predicted transglutaminase-like cysteine proteinase